MKAWQYVIESFTGLVTWLFLLIECVLQGLLCLGRIKRAHMRKKDWRLRAQREIDVSQVLVMLGSRCHFNSKRIKA